MDEFLALVGVQAMRYAIRSSIALASTYAVGQVSHLVKSADDHKVYAEIKTLHDRFESKVKIISPAVDLIELRSGRGNVFLESAAPMTKALQRDIASLTSRIERILQPVKASPAHIPEATRQAAMRDVRSIIEDLRQLLDRIDREIPLLQLAITASGESLSTSLPPSISPSRLLQASTLLVVGDIQFSRDPGQTVQIGPTFSLSLYMLFLGHAPRRQRAGQSQGAEHDHSNMGASYGLGPADRKPIWQEVVHKARLRLLRTAARTSGCDVGTQARAYRYALDITEDLDDGLVHTDLENDFDHASAPPLVSKDVIPVQEVSKLFYTDAGRILNLGHEDAAQNNPILLLKRDMKRDLLALHRSGSDQTEQDDVDQQLLGESEDANGPSESNTYSLPGMLSSAPYLDPEWIAFEIFQDAEGLPKDASSSDSDVEEDEEPDKEVNLRDCHHRSIHEELEKVGLNHSSTSSDRVQDVESCSGSPLGAITTSLSLLEMLIRLASLQEFQNTSHLAIPDHILAFFLEETSGTGLVGDAQLQARMDAKSKVGFDPYTDRKEMMG